MDWLSHALLPIEASEFKHWRGMKALVEVVHSAVESEAAWEERAAKSAIEQYNKRKGTQITFNEVRDLDHRHIPVGIGEWQVWTDNQVGLLRGPYDEPWEAFSYSNDSVKWVIATTVEGSVLVFKSPFIGGRRRFENEEGEEEEGIDGLSKGDIYAHTLSPEIEASVKQDLDPDMPETVYIGPDPLHDNPNDLHF